MRVAQYSEKHYLPAGHISQKYIPYLFLNFLHTDKQTGKPTDQKYMPYRKLSEITTSIVRRIKDIDRSHNLLIIENKKAVLPQGNRAMPQVFFSVEVRQQHSLQV